MNKVALYILLILIFLGASKSFVTEKKGRHFIFNEHQYTNIFKDKPVSVILLDASRSGFIIKSNIHRYRVIWPLDQIQTINVRVSKKYFRSTLGYIGMSLFRRNRKGIESTVPSIPGTMFINDSGFGVWRLDQSGERFWYFFSEYRHYERSLLWSGYRTSLTEYKELLQKVSSGHPFMGKDNQFGSEGRISQKMLPMEWYKKRNKEFSIKDYIEEVTKLPIFRKS